MREYKLINTKIVKSTSSSIVAVVYSTNVHFKISETVNLIMN